MHHAPVHRLAVCVIMGLLCQLPVWPENPSMNLVSNGGCDPAIPDAHGDVTFLCHGLTDEQVHLLPKISTVLDKLMKNSNDATLDSVLVVLQPGAAPKNEAAVSPPSPTPDLQGLTAAVHGIPAASPPKGNVISYDYRGYRRSSLTGPVPGDEGESKEYQKLLKLQKSGEWKKLFKEATREIKKVPEWLTPYAFGAVAIYHLGNRTEAVKLLQHVDQQSAGDPDYDQVRHMLAQLKSKT
jgi:hypothetical protein